MCPHCGSLKTIPIKYGMATYEAALLEEQGKVKLGGCEVYPERPIRWCPRCKRSFGSNIPFELKAISLEFFIGGPFGPSHKIHLDNQTDESGQFFANYFYDPEGIGYSSQKIPIGHEDDWMRLMGRIGLCNILDWEKSYDDPNILDGTFWELKLRYWDSLNEPEKTQAWGGSNAFPGSFKRFCYVLSKALGRQIE